jgi:VanZ family protein
MAVVFVLSAQPNLNSGLREDFLLRKCAHVCEYVLLTLLWARALAGLRPAWPAVRAAAGAAAIALLWAASDEWHQTFVTGRVGAVHDVGIDAIGVTIALLLLWRTRVGVRLGVRRRRS